MMRRKVYPAVLFALLAGLALAACKVSTAPVQQIATVVVTAVPTTAPPLAQEPTAEAPTAAPVATLEPQPTLVTGSPVQAALTVQSGQVEVGHPFQSSYTAIRQGQTVQVSAGDVIRTGSSGTARLVFLDNTETVIFPNTVLVIDTFNRDSSGAHSIRLTQLIGKTFNRVNFTNPNSRQEVITPYGVASVRGTGYWVEVTISGPAATTLLAQDVSAFEAQVGQAVVSGDSSALMQAVVTLLGATPGTVSADVGAGTVVFTDNVGNIVFVKTGVTADSGTDEDGDTVTVTTRVIDRFCGDGVCDPYLGETAATCSADCG